MSSSRISRFYRLPPAERRRRLIDLAGLSAEAFAALDLGGLTLDVADGMIENVVGVYGLPFAVAVNFTVDGSDALVPMVIEEPSVVAAASNAARMVRPRGFSTVVSAPVMIGQIQVTDIADLDAAASVLRARSEELLGSARRLVPRLAERGGGPIALDVRPLTRSGPDGGVLVVHLHVDCRDAMGANLVNTLCEALATRVAELAGGRPGLRILSNLTDGRTVTVRCSVDDAALASDAAAASTSAMSVTWICPIITGADTTVWNPAGRTMRAAFDAAATIDGSSTTIGTSASRPSIVKFTATANGSA